MTTLVVDANEQPLAEGSRVRLVGTEDEFGVVLYVSDPDGDMVEGRMIGYPPTVRVRFDDGVEDSLPASSRARWYDEDPNYQCDDLVALTEGR